MQEIHLVKLFTLDFTRSNFPQTYIPKLNLWSYLIIIYFIHLVKTLLKLTKTSVPWFYLIITAFSSFLHIFAKQTAAFFLNKSVFSLIIFINGTIKSLNSGNFSGNTSENADILEQQLMKFSFSYFSNDSVKSVKTSVTYVSKILRLNWCSFKQTSLNPWTLQQLWKILKLLKTNYGKLLLK